MLSHTNDISPCSGLDRHTLYSLTQIVYLGQSIQAAPTLSTSWRATLAQSLPLSLSLCMSRLTSLFLGHKRYISMFEPNSTYSYCILSHAHCLSRSLSPTRLTLSIARRPTLAQSLSLYICNRLTLLPPMHKIYLRVYDWIIFQALSYSPHPSQKLNRTISLQSIYIFSMNVGPHSLCLSIYMSLD